MTDINYKYLWMAFIWIGGFLIGCVVQHAADENQIADAYVDGWDDATEWCEEYYYQSILTERIHNLTFVNSPNHIGG